MYRKMRVNKPGMLDFADYIKQLPPQWVIEHFLKGSDSSRKILSSSMVEDAVKRFNTPEELKRRFLDLSPSLQLRCALVYLSGNHGVTLQVTNPFDDPLLSTFLTYAATSINGTTRIFGFHQFEKQLRTEFANVIRNAASEDFEASLSESFRWRVLNDITMAAALCLQGVWVKKRYGGFSKTTMTIFKKLIDTGPFSTTEVNEFVLSAILSYLKSKKMVIETESQFNLVLPAFTNWLQENANDRLQEFECFCFEYCGGWNRKLLIKLFEHSNKWYSSHLFEQHDRVDLINTLHLLRFCGFLELQSRNDHLYFHNVKPASQAFLEQKRQIVVLPDFSSIIPQEIDSVQLFRFNQLGTIRSLDKVYWGKVEKEVLLNSCARGTDASLILEWLSQWQAPVNVLETTREWLREFSRLYVTDQHMLVSNDEKVTMQIDSYEPVREFLEPVNAHAVFRIKKGNEERVREILQNLGFDYRMPGQETVAIKPEHEEKEETYTAEENWIAVTQTEREVSEPFTRMRGTKYGSELKVLDTAEIVHVIDYAILTGVAVIIEYEGSPYLKQGIYTVKPLTFQKGIDPTFEGEVTRTKSRKMFYLKKIRKIGVVQK